MKNTIILAILMIPLVVSKSIKIIEHQDENNEVTVYNQCWQRKCLAQIDACAAQRSCIDQVKKCSNEYKLSLKLLTVKKADFKTCLQVDRLATSSYDCLKRESCITTDIF